MPLRDVPKQYIIANTVPFNELLKAHFDQKSKSENRAMQYNYPSCGSLHATGVKQRFMHSRLQHELPGLGVLGDVGSQAHGTRALARGVLAPGHQAVHVLRGCGEGVASKHRYIIQVNRE